MTPRGSAGLSGGHGADRSLVIVDQFAEATASRPDVFMRDGAFDDITGQPRCLDLGLSSRALSPCNRLESSDCAGLAQPFKMRRRKTDKDAALRLVACQAGEVENGARHL